MSDKHKNKQDMWKFEDILGTLGFTEQDYKLLVLELKRCKIMNQTVKRIFDATDNKKREAVRQLTAYIGQQNPDIYALEENVEGSAEVSFDKPIDPEELKKRMNSSYNAVKSDMELSNRGFRSYVGEKTKIMAFEREMEQAKSDLEKLPFFRFIKRSELRRSVDYMEREQDYLLDKVERKMTENQKIKDAKEKSPVLTNREKGLRHLATEIKDILKENNREQGKSSETVTKSAGERVDEDLFR